MKKFISAAAVTISLGLSSVAYAQELDLDALLADLSAACSNQPAQCDQFTADVMGTLQAAGLSEDALNQSIGAVIATITVVANSLPPGQKVQIAKAVNVAAGGFQGNGPAVQAQIAAANGINTALANGGNVDNSVFSQLGSGN